MDQSSTLLDPVSEILALTTYGNRKNLIIAALELEGPLDFDAFVSAVHRTIDYYPQLRSCLTEIKSRGRYFLARTVRTHQVPTLNLHDIRDAPPSDAAPLDRLLSCLEPDMDRERDLFSELPCEVHVVRISDKHHVVALVLHHSFGDAAFACEVGQRLLICYQEIRTGQKVTSTCYNRAVSTSGKRRARQGKTDWKDLVRRTRHFLTPWLKHATLPRGSGAIQDQRMFVTKRVLSEASTDRVIQAPRKKNVSLIDFLVASSSVSIDRWNLARGVPSGSIACYISVNTRGRYRESNALNDVALLYFHSKPNERALLDLFTRSISLGRINRFRKRMDSDYSRGMAMLLGCGRHFPFKARRRIADFVSERAQLSIAITLMGVVWPKESNGRPTAESCLNDLGELQVTAVHGFGYKLHSRTPLQLAAYIFRNKLNLILMASACHFTREEAESFFDLILEQLTEDA